MTDSANMVAVRLDPTLLNRAHSAVRDGVVALLRQERDSGRLDATDEMIDGWALRAAGKARSDLADMLLVAYEMGKREAEK